MVENDTQGVTRDTGVILVVVQSLPGTGVPRTTSVSCPVCGDTEKGKKGPVCPEL